MRLIRLFKENRKRGFVVSEFLIDDSESWFYTDEKYNGGE